MAPNTIGREQPVRKRLVAKKPAKCDSDSSELYEPKVKSKRESSTSNKSSVWSSIGWMTIGCVIGCILITSVPTPQFVRQLAQLKRQLMPGPAKIIVPLTSAPLQDTRPATQQPGQQEVGENGEMYEYHQFMAAVEQHFDNVR